MAGNERDFGEAADKSRKREGESEIRTRPGGRKGERLWSEGDWQAVCLHGIVGAWIYSDKGMLQCKLF